MPNILLVEDDDNKISAVSLFLRSTFPDLTLFTARSFQTGWRALQENSVRIVVLDMTLPNYDLGPEEDGGKIRPFGGQEFLRKMRRRGLKTPVVVLTQFETFGSGEDRLDIESLRDQLGRTFPEHCKGTIYYNSAVDTWKSELQSLLKDIIERVDS